MNEKIPLIAFSIICITFSIFAGYNWYQSNKRYEESQRTLSYYIRYVSDESKRFTTITDNNRQLTRNYSELQSNYKQLLADNDKLTSNNESISRLNQQMAERLRAITQAASEGIRLTDTKH